MSIRHGTKRITEKQLGQWVTMIADQQDYLTKLNILLPSLTDKDEIKHVKYLQGITIEAIQNYKATYNKLNTSYKRHQAHLRVQLKLMAIELPPKQNLMS